ARPGSSLRDSSSSRSASGKLRFSANAAPSTSWPTGDLGLSITKRRAIRTAVSASPLRRGSMASPIGAGAVGASGTGAGVLGDEESGAANPGAVQRARIARAKARRLTRKVYHFGGTGVDWRALLKGQAVMVKSRCEHIERGGARVPG